MREPGKPAKSPKPLESPRSSGASPSNQKSPTLLELLLNYSERQQVFRGLFEMAFLQPVYPDILARFNPLFDYLDESVTLPKQNFQRADNCLKALARSILKNNMRFHIWRLVMEIPPEEKNHKQIVSERLAIINALNVLFHPGVEPRLAIYQKLRQYCNDGSLARLPSEAVFQDSLLQGSFDKLVGLVRHINCLSPESNLLNKIEAFEEDDQLGENIRACVWTCGNSLAKNFLFPSIVCSKRTIPKSKAVFLRLVELLVSLSVDDRFQDAVFELRAPLYLGVGELLMLKPVQVVQLHSKQHNEIFLSLAMLVHRYQLISKEEGTNPRQLFEIIDEVYPDEIKEHVKQAMLNPGVRCESVLPSSDKASRSHGSKKSSLFWLRRRRGSLSRSGKKAGQEIVVQNPLLSPRLKRSLSRVSPTSSASPRVSFMPPQPAPLPTSHSAGELRSRSASSSPRDIKPKAQSVTGPFTRGAPASASPSTTSSDDSDEPRVPSPS